MIVFLYIAAIFWAGFIGYLWWDHYTFWKKFYGGKYPWWIK